MFFNEERVQIGVSLSLFELLLTKYHGLGSIQTTTEIYFSRFWRLKVQDLGVSMVG